MSMQCPNETRQVKLTYQYFVPLVGATSNRFGHVLARNTLERLACIGHWSWSMAGWIRTSPATRAGSSGAGYWSGNTLNDGRCRKQPAIYFVVVGVVLDTDTGMWLATGQQGAAVFGDVYGGPDRTWRRCLGWRLRWGRGFETRVAWCAFSAVGGKVWLWPTRAIQPDVNLPQIWYSLRPLL
jgi:hypothetical protein